MKREEECHIVIVPEWKALGEELGIGMVGRGGNDSYTPYGEILNHRR